MHSATLHGVGVITKLYFAIFAGFKESVTLNLAQRSFKVIHFGGNRKLVEDRAKATINGLYKVVHGLSIAAKIYNFESLNDL